MANKRASYWRRCLLRLWLLWDSRFLCSSSCCCWLLLILDPELTSRGESSRVESNESGVEGLVSDLEPPTSTILDRHDENNEIFEKKMTDFCGSGQ